MDIVKSAQNYALEINGYCSRSAHFPTKTVEGVLVKALSRAYQAGAEQHYTEKFKAIEAAKKPVTTQSFKERVKSFIKKHARRTPW